MVNVSMLIIAQILISGDRLAEARMETGLFKWNTKKELLRKNMAHVPVPPIWAVNALEVKLDRIFEPL